MTRARANGQLKKTEGRAKRPPRGKASTYKLYEDELPDIREEIKRFFDDPEPWLHTPNDRLWGHTPAELIGTEKEIWVRDLLRRAKYGLMS